MNALTQILSGKLEGKEEEEEVWLAACNASFAAMIKDKQSREAEEAKATVSPFKVLMADLSAVPGRLHPNLCSHAQRHHVQHVPLRTVGFVL